MRDASLTGAALTEARRAGVIFCRRIMPDGGPSDGEFRPARQAAAKERPFDALCAGTGAI